MVAARPATETPPTVADDRPPWPSRRRRAAAVALDVGVVVGLHFVASLLAVTWLLVATDAGTFDPSPRETSIGLGIVAAAGPAWYAWQALRVAMRGATTGQVRLGERVGGLPWRRLLRLLLHPLTVVLWLWLATYLAVLGYPAAAIGALVLTAAWAGLGIASTVLLLLSTEARPLHDRLAGTSLLRR